MKTDVQIVDRWARCQEMANRFKLTIMSNRSDLFSIVDDGSFIFNCNTVDEVYAYLSACERFKTP